MAEENLPKPILNILGQVGKGTINTAVAAKRLGEYLDKKFGTEGLSAFPIKKGYSGKAVKKKKKPVAKKTGPR
tara:strand:- start:597 stop:815 length:219 start_codon:yes stop_codon:yes gene_type:complete